MQQLSPPPHEKELPAPNEKLLRAPTFREKLLKRQGKVAKWLAISSIILFIFIFTYTLLLKSQKPTITPIQPTQPTINAIEISTDQKSILNAKTKEVIFTIEDAKNYLKNSGYEYNPDTFQTTNDKYLGDCFGDAALSNNKDRIIFSTSCLPGDLPQAWIGIYYPSIDYLNKNRSIELDCGYNYEPINFSFIPKASACVPSSPIKFLIAGSGKNFIWSQEDKAITYEANLGLSGLTEIRTIDSQAGNILKSRDKVREILQTAYNQETDNIPGGILKKVPAEIKKKYNKNGQIYLSIDILSWNPDFVPGLARFFINQSTKLKEVYLENTTKAYGCKETIADMPYPLDEFTNNANEGDTYYFDIQNDAITSIYGQCLP